MSPPLGHCWLGRLSVLWGRQRWADGGVAMAVMVIMIALMEMDGIIRSCLTSSALTH